MDKLTSSPRLNKLLYNMGIFNYYDVINHLPRRYEDLSYTQEKNLEDKQRVVLLGKIMSLPKINKGRKIHVTYFDFMTVHKTYFRVVAFNRPYLGGNINLVDDFTLIGVYNAKRGEIDFINMYKGRIDPKNAIKPIYSLPQGYENYQYSMLAKKALKELGSKIYSLVPYEYINKYRLVNKEQAMNWAHFPQNHEEVRQALRHLKYEEALMFSLKNQIIRKQNKSLAKIKKEPIDLSLCEPWLKTLPYELTNDQKKAAEEIIEDMNQSGLMYRLLQGDVGTGKTLVCFAALYANFIRGDQGALMAPTDALARQHYNNAIEAFKGTKINIALLLGSTPQSKKKEIYQDLEDGTINIVIGTHALFAKSCVYSSLGLAIIDEQHRFGVNQRLTLADKGEHTDLLMMSATPIPRSLALSIYGDLDVSTLTEFPNKKRSVKTQIVDSDNKLIYEKIDESLKTNHRIYVVAPLITFNEDDRFSAEQLFFRFNQRYNGKVGLLHGKMKVEEKEEALNKFYSGELPILVSTQVIEVGIDVKAANLMIIYDASNFGLASLHQLRGRIGRDGTDATCLLTLDEDDEELRNRLLTLVNSEDGFAIAEVDMKLRGPGELTGLRQSGIPSFSFLNIVDDFKIFMVARDDAKAIIADSDNPKYKFIISKAERDVNNSEMIKG